jgi:hypothetical protein
MAADGYVVQSYVVGSKKHMDAVKETNYSDDSEYFAPGATDAEKDDKRKERQNNTLAGVAVADITGSSLKQFVEVASGKIKKDNGKVVWDGDVANDESLDHLISVLTEKRNNPTRGGDVTNEDIDKAIADLTDMGLGLWTP